MKRLSIILVGLLVVLLASHVQAGVVVSSNPLWTDTGITLIPSDVVTISGAGGSWTWGGVPHFGPDGDYQPSLAWDEWITNDRHGQLIGYVGTVVDPNVFPRVIPQNDPSLFPIGSGSLTTSGRSGKLWLGFNDDYSSAAVGDNSGRVDVNVSVSSGIPEPAAVAVWSLLGLASVGFGWRKRRA